VLYDSSQHLLETIEPAEHQKPRHMLQGRLPQGERFIDEIPKLIDLLSEQLGIPRDHLDATETSLDEIDEALRRMGSRRALQPPIFPALMAYVGEVIRHEVGGLWRLQLAADNETWEPWVLDGQGRLHPPFALV